MNHVVKLLIRKLNENHQPCFEQNWWFKERCLDYLLTTSIRDANPGFMFS